MGHSEQVTASTFHSGEGVHTDPTGQQPPLRICVPHPSSLGPWVVNPKQWTLGLQRENLKAEPTMGKGHMVEKTVVRRSVQEGRRSPSKRGHRFLGQGLSILALLTFAAGLFSGVGAVLSTVGC